MSFVPSIVALSAMAAVAVWITVARGGIRDDASALSSAVRVAMLAIAAQVVHFGEEAAGGLNRRLPELFGLEPVSMDAFVSVNLVALGIWALSVVALAGRSGLALFPLWFLGVASVSNAVLHPALALAAGGAFPGVWTSPVVGVTGALLLRALMRITRADGEIGRDP